MAVNDLGMTKEQADEFERKWLENTFGCEFVKNNKGEWVPKRDESTAYGTDCPMGGCE